MHRHRDHRRAVEKQEEERDIVIVPLVQAGFLTGTKDVCASLTSLPRPHLLRPLCLVPFHLDPLLAIDFCDWFCCSSQPHIVRKERRRFCQTRPRF
jgi:hypothetical protein